MPFCSQCGKPVEPELDFCSNCGAEVAGDNGSGGEQAAEGTQRCDLCGEFMRGEGQIVSPEEMRIIAGNDYGKELTIGQEMPPAQRAAKLYQLALVNETDWLVCNRCFQATREYAVDEDEGPSHEMFREMALKPLMDAMQGHAASGTPEAELAEAIQALGGDSGSPSRETRKRPKKKRGASAASRKKSSRSPGVGKVKDCAQPGGFGSVWRALLYFAFGIPITGFGLLGLAALCSTLLQVGPWAGDDVQEGIVPMAVMTGVILLIGWPIFMTGVRRWREAIDRRFYFRIGAQGISICVPGQSNWFWFEYPLEKHDVVWDDIASFKCWTEESHGSAPFGKVEFLFETTSGEFIGINTRYFVENAMEIHDNMTKALERHPPAVFFTTS